MGWGCCQGGQSSRSPAIPGESQGVPENLRLGAPPLPHFQMRPGERPSTFPDAGGNFSLFLIISRLAHRQNQTINCGFLRDEAPRESSPQTALESKCWDGRSQ